MVPKTRSGTNSVTICNNMDKHTSMQTQRLRNRILSMIEPKRFYCQMSWIFFLRYVVITKDGPSIPINMLTYF